MQELTTSQWELMRVCWDLGPATARQVHEASLASKPRNYRTVLATLNNIVKREFLKVEKISGPRKQPTNLYRPVVSRRSATEERIRRCLGPKSRVCGPRRGGDRTGDTAQMDRLAPILYTAFAETSSERGAQQDLYPGSRR